MKARRWTSAQGKAKKAYQVRWKEGNKRRAATFPTHREAEEFKAQRRRLKQLGELVFVDRGRMLLSEHVEDWWEKHAMVRLERATKIGYRSILRQHILPQLGNHSLAELEQTPELLDNFNAYLITRAAELFDDKDAGHQATIAASPQGSSIADLEQLRGEVAVVMGRAQNRWRARTASAHGWPSHTRWSSGRRVNTVCMSAWSIDASKAHGISGFSRRELGEASARPHQIWPLQLAPRLSCCPSETASSRRDREA